MTPTPTPTAETLNKLSKPELQEEYKKVIDSPADAALSKGQLVQAILDKLAQVDAANGGEGNGTPGGNEGLNDKGPDQGDPGDEHTDSNSGNAPGTEPLETPTPTPTAETEAEVPTGHVRLVKLEDGKIVDQSTMTQAAWDNLPQHKFGWSIAKPKELQ